jgi:hypothetical protein
MQFHAVIDRRTGQMCFRGRDGRDYTAAEVESAKTRAASGDLEATALLATIEMRGTDEELAAQFRQIVDDCPECQAARARGEQPTMFDARDFTALHRPRKPKPKKERWRKMKRMPPRR